MYFGHMNDLVLKSLHIIFVVTWFAGLFYIFRLFVYHAEAARKTEPSRSILMDQYRIMERRLWYGITWPSCILTVIFGSLLLYSNPMFLNQPWMHIKLFAVALLLVYQFYGQRVIKNLQIDPLKYTSMKMRLMNEVPTLILFAVVFLVVMKSEISWIWGTLAISGIAVIITLVVQAYKKKRKKNGEQV